MSAPSSMEQAIEAVGLRRYQQLLEQLHLQIAALADRILDGGAPADIGREAHRLRGAAGSLGATVAAEALAELENECVSDAISDGWPRRLADLAQRQDTPPETNR